ncbi:MAG TPA: ABC transporter ATP-binding protein, partial [Candidatus Norongarragalinales archaeon]|nr:ABC transporter ATP-binding protein [Candidatus Norongarragalinales archaeon]
MALKLEREVHTLEIRDLYASVEGKPVLKGVNLTVTSGQIHALMGPNGSGKTSLSCVIMGHPKYEVQKGDILMDGQSLLDLPVEERARKGLFLAFQYPLEIPGVTVANFLRSACNEGLPKEKQAGAFSFQNLLFEKMDELKIPRNFAERYLNEGFSGGEKKRCEILQ